MRCTLPLFRIPRRRAAEVLETAQKKLAASPNSSESQTFFNELPPVLQRFFKEFPPAPFREYATTPRPTNAPDANPFLANKHPVTQAWHRPRYSMRRQADLWKAAYRFGVQHLLPQLLHNRKFYEDKYAETQQIRGAQQFKLTKRERKAPQRAQEVSEAVAQLDDKILERKGRRYGKFLEEKNRLGHV